VLVLLVLVLVPLLLLLLMARVALTSTLYCTHPQLRILL
jgi:hypothetical protein